MEEREKNEFSWTGLFLVTGLCFIFFNGLIKLMDGSNMPVFSRVGIACLLLGALNGIGNRMIKTDRKKNKTVPSHNN
jgi:hypothetical protein